MRVRGHRSQNGLRTIGFSLLSAGIFRGKRSLADVLSIGVSAIGESAYPGLEEVHLVGYTNEELQTLCWILEQGAEDEGEGGEGGAEGEEAEGGADGGGGSGVMAYK